MKIKHPWRLDELTPDPGMVARRHIKGQVNAWVHEAFELIYSNVPATAGRCLYWTHVGCAVLRTCGFRAILQAGTLQWPVAPDRGANVTHLSYIWHGTKPRIPGIMPEYHAWCAIPDENIIVDFATHEFPRTAARIGLKWELPQPPQFLWTPANALPEGVFYRPSMEAISYIFHRLATDNCKPSVDVNTQSEKSATRRLVQA